MGHENPSGMITPDTNDPSRIISGEVENRKDRLNRELRGLWDEIDAQYREAEDAFQSLPVKEEATEEETERIRAVGAERSAYAFLGSAFARANEIADPEARLSELRQKLVEETRRLAAQKGPAGKIQHKIVSDVRYKLAGLH